MYSWCRVDLGETSLLTILLLKLRSRTLTKQTLFTKECIQPANAKQSKIISAASKWSTHFREFEITYTHHLRSLHLQQGILVILQQSHWCIGRIQISERSNATQDRTGQTRDFFPTQLQNKINHKIEKNWIPMSKNGLTFCGNCVPNIAKSTRGPPNQESALAPRALLLWAAKILEDTWSKVDASWRVSGACCFLYEWLCCPYHFAPGPGKHQPVSVPCNYRATDW